MPRGVGGGPKPKPLALHKIDGTMRPHRHGKRREPIAPGVLTTKAVPEWMTDDQRALWADVLVDAPFELMRRIDWSIFANYIELMDRHAKAVVAQQKLDHNSTAPFLAQSKRGVMISPYLRVINHCVLLMTRLQAEMGFTPSARARIALDQDPHADEVEDDVWGQLYNFRVVQGGKE